jgi:Flp pilus assembly protein TadD
VLLLASDPENQVAKTQMAIVFAKYGLVQRALDTLAELLTLNPRSAEAYNTKGNIYLSTGEYGQAVDAYQKAEDLDTEDGGIKINMSIAYYRGGELSLARNKYQQALQQHPQLAERYASLGSLLIN